MDTLIAGPAPRQRPGAGVLFLSTLLLAPVANANGLDELRTALRGLAEASPVRAEVVRHVTYEQKDNPPRLGNVTVNVTKDAAGLRIAFPEEQLRQAAREHAQTDPDRPRPASEGLRSVDPAEVHALLGYSKRLLAHLDGATLVSEAPADYRGAPARLLEIELLVRLSQAGRKRIREARSTMKIWCGRDGLPLALEEQQEFRGRIFLVIGFEVHQSRALRFARAGDRLVVVHQDERNGGSGLGESAAEARTTTLKVL